MKRLLFLLLSLPLFVYTQSIAELDKLTGFKDLKFGTLKKTLLDMYAIDGQPNTFGYYGNCCTTLFGYDVKDIRLVFDSQDKLTKIYVRLKSRFQADGQERLLNTVEYAFGETTGREGYGNSGDLTFQWMGSKVCLSLVQLYHGAHEGGWDAGFCFELKSGMGVSDY